jgi:hypothetical protein
MARTAEFYTAAAAAAFEAGFTCEAARKRALADVNRAFELTERTLRDRLLASRDADNNMTATANDLYYSFPSYPHLYSAKVDAAVRAEGYDDLAVEFISFRDLRNALKAAEIVKVERPAAEEKIAAVRATIVEEMERRHTAYLECLDIARHFNGLPVSVTAHWVFGHKGTRFLRHFFYVGGKLTALQVIMAAAETYQRETEGA